MPALLAPVFNRLVLTMKNHIDIGSRVTFDSEDGIQTGTVTNIKSDLGNGRAIALIHVRGAQDGAPFYMPVSDLQQAGAA